MEPFTALADPHRRRMIELLGSGERPAGAIAGEFAMTSAAVSQHLKALREAGLVRVRVDGARRIYSLDPNGLAAVDAWLGRFRSFWSARLDDLETALREDEGDRK
jgi:DNA-binding transcriptional ArsR family regulator